MKSIDNYSKSAIRYALYRVRDDRAPTDEHFAIANMYIHQLEEHDFSFKDFNIKWDINPNNTKKIIYGRSVKKMKSELNTPLIQV